MYNSGWQRLCSGIRVSWAVGRSNIATNIEKKSTHPHNGDEQGGDFCGGVS